MGKTITGLTEKTTVVDDDNLVIVDSAVTTGKTKKIKASTLKTYAGGGTGTVTNVSSADGNATVATQTTTPVITIVSAPKLQTARTIAGVSFDGTANISIPGSGLTVAALADGMTATTQAAGSNDTKMATNAYVKTAMDAQLASYYPLVRSYFAMWATQTANTYFMMTYSGNSLIATTSNNAVQFGPALIYISSADYPSVNGLVPKLRIRASVSVNDAAPGANFTFGLYSITTPAASGGAGLRAWTIGTVVTGSNGATVTAPAADSQNTLVGSDFTLPADGWYAICILTAGTIASSSFVHCMADLQITYK